MYTPREEGSCLSSLWLYLLYLACNWYMLSGWMGGWIDGWTDGWKDIINYLAQVFYPVWSDL